MPRHLLPGVAFTGQELHLAIHGGDTIKLLITGARLCYTARRRIRRTEIWQTAWRTYRGPYWLLTLRAA